MAIEIPESTWSAVGDWANHELPNSRPPSDPASRLPWAEEQRAAWMQLALDSERWIEQLEQGRAFLSAQVERQAKEIEAHAQQLEEKQQTLEALQRRLNHARRRLQAVESSANYRIVIAIRSVSRKIPGAWFHAPNIALVPVDRSTEVNVNTAKDKLANS